MEGINWDEALVALVGLVGALIIGTSLGRLKDETYQAHKLLNEQHKRHWLVDIIMGAIRFFTEFVEALILAMAELVGSIVAVISTMVSGRMWTVTKQSKQIEVKQPPRFAKLFMRFFVKSVDQEIILGDMQEIFHKVGNENGYVIAKLWYIWHTSWTICSVVIGKLVKLGVWAFLADTVKKMIGW